MSTDEPRQTGREAILLALERHAVRYVVIGGAAAQSRGWRGTTLDIDVTPERSRENLTRLAGAVKELDASFRIDPERYPDGLRPPGGFDWRTFRGQEWVTLASPHGDFDVVFLPAGTDGYAEIVATATPERVNGTKLVVPVASAEIVLRSKATANRPKDQEVLQVMREQLDPWRSREGHDPPDR
jgi:hypothetical protein